MKYLSVCSGIEAASVAWHPLGWEPVAFSEIEPFPCAVLAHHYPTVPNLGDLTKWREWPQDLLAQTEVLIGGTPCQSFSVAGLRKGLSDARGNIMLHYIELANAIDDLRRDHGRPPIWILWENVPGVFSDKTNGFGALLGGLCGSDAAVPRPSGGGWPDAGVAAGPQRTAAWRVLDAQYFGVAQRRRRVFVLALGGAGAWACADALLPIGESVSRHPPPRREARQGVAGSLAARTRGGGGLGIDFECGGGLVPQTVGALTDGAHNGGGSTDRTPTPGESLPSLAMCLNAGAMGRQDAESETLIPTIGGGFDVAHSLRGEGFDASEDGTGQGTPLVPIAWTEELTASIDIAGTVQRRGSGGRHDGVAVPMINMQGGKGSAVAQEDGPSFTLNAMHGHDVHAVAVAAQPYSIMPMNSGRDYKARPTDIAQPIMAGGPVGGNQGGDVVVQPVAFNNTGAGWWDDAGDTAATRRAESNRASTESTLVAEPYTLAIRGRGDTYALEYRQDGTANALLTPNGGRGGIGVGAIAIQAGAIKENPDIGPDGIGIRTDDCAYTLEARAEVQAVAFPIISDADRADSAALTPSPDAEGRIRLRDPGLGVGEDGDPMFTLQATKPHAVAFHPTQDPISSEEVCRALGTGSSEGCATAAVAVAVDCYNGAIDGSVTHSIRVGNGNAMGGIPSVLGRDLTRQQEQPHAHAPQANAGTLLRRVRDQVGAQAFAEWGLGILDSLQPPEVLRQALHGSELRPAAFTRRWVVCCALGSPFPRSEGAVQSLREALGEGRSSPGSQPPQQLSRELGAYLSELSQPGAQAERFLRDLWQAAEGLGLLRQALSAVQEVRRRGLGQGQPVHADPQGNDAEPGEDVQGAGLPEEVSRERVLRSSRAASEKGQAAGSSMMVRRLTPECCEFLQGFHRGYTRIPWRNKPAEDCPDGPRYKALGNSMATPVINYIGRRISAVTSKRSEAA